MRRRQSTISYQKALKKSRPPPSASAIADIKGKLRTILVPKTGEEGRKEGRREKRTLGMCWMGMGGRRRMEDVRARGERQKRRSNDRAALKETSVDSSSPRKKKQVVRRPVRINLSCTRHERRTFRNWRCQTQQARNERSKVETHRDRSRLES